MTNVKQFFKKNIQGAKDQLKMKSSEKFNECINFIVFVFSGPIKFLSYNL